MFWENIIPVWPTLCSHVTTLHYFHSSLLLPSLRSAVIQVNSPSGPVFSFTFIFSPLSSSSFISYKSSHKSIKEQQICSLSWIFYIKIPKKVWIFTGFLCIVLFYTNIFGFRTKIRNSNTVCLFLAWRNCDSLFFTPNFNCLKFNL